MAGAVPLTGSREPPRLQPLTRANVASLGEAGAAWHAALPDVLADLCRAWSLALGRPLPGGSHSYVVGVTTADGDEAVLKVALEDDAFDDQVRVLRRADGRGYVRLLAFDGARSAMLLERLGPTLESAGLEPEAQLTQLVDTLEVAWQPVAPDQTPQAKAASLAEMVSELQARLGRPGPETVVDQALAYAEELAAVPDGELVVVHGDPHPANALRVLNRRAGAETGYCFVDPDGFVTDRAYDLGVALRDWSSRLTGDDARMIAERYCEVLADRSGVAYERIWRWGYLERVSTGLYVMSFGGPGPTRLGRSYLAAAERLLDLG